MTHEYTINFQLRWKTHFFCRKWFHSEKTFGVQPKNVLLSGNIKVYFLGKLNKPQKNNSLICILKCVENSI